MDFEPGTKKSQKACPKMIPIKLPLMYNIYVDYGRQTQRIKDSSWHSMTLKHTE